MTILGVDIGQSLGWAVWCDGRVCAYGTLKLPGKSPDKLARNFDRLRELIRLYSPDRVAVEDVQFVSYRDAHASYWRIRTLFELAWALEGGAELHAVPTGELKRWSTGNPKASKADMCAAASQRVGTTLLSQAEGGTKAQEDQADAILVACWAAELSTRD